MCLQSPIELTVTIMGKNKKGQRTKGNLQPASSASAVSALASPYSKNITAISFSAFREKSEDDGLLPLFENSKLDPLLLLSFKKMLKRDDASKMRALEEVCHALNDVSVATELLPHWTRIFRRLSIDRNVRVRVLCLRAHSMIINHVGRQVAPYLKSLVTFWLISTKDISDVSSVATESLLFLFPGEKLKNAIEFCTKTIIDELTEYMTTQKLEFIGDHRFYSKEEMRENCDRILGLCISLMTFLLKEYKIAVPVLETPEFQAHLKSNSALVREAMGHLVHTLLEAKEGSVDLISQLSTLIWTEYDNNVLMTWWPAFLAWINDEYISKCEVSVTSITNNARKFSEYLNVNQKRALPPLQPSIFPAFTIYFSKFHKTPFDIILDAVAKYSKYNRLFGSDILQFWRFVSDLLLLSGRQVPSDISQLIAPIIDAYLGIRTKWDNSFSSGPNDFLHVICERSTFSEIIGAHLCNRLETISSINENRMILLLEAIKSHETNARVAQCLMEGLSEETNPEIIHKFLAILNFLRVSVDIFESNIELLHCSQCLQNIFDLLPECKHESALKKIPFEFLKDVIPHVRARNSNGIKLIVQNLISLEEFDNVEEIIEYDLVDPNYVLEMMVQLNKGCVPYKMFKNVVISNDHVRFLLNNATYDWNMLTLSSPLIVAQIMVNEWLHDAQIDSIKLLQTVEKTKCLMDVEKIIFSTRFIEYSANLLTKAKNWEVSTTGFYDCDLLEVDTGHELFATKLFHLLYFIGPINSHAYLILYCMLGCILDESWDIPFQADFPKVIEQFYSDKITTIHLLALEKLIQHVPIDQIEKYDFSLLATSDDRDRLRLFSALMCFTNQSGHFDMESAQWMFNLLSKPDPIYFMLLNAIKFDVSEPNTLAKILDDALEWSNTDNYGIHQRTHVALLLARHSHCEYFAQYCWLLVDSCDIQAPLFGILLSTVIQAFVDNTPNGPDADQFIGLCATFFSRGVSCLRLSQFTERINADLFSEDNLFAIMETGEIHQMSAAFELLKRVISSRLNEVSEHLANRLFVKDKILSWLLCWALYFEHFMCSDMELKLYWSQSVPLADMLECVTNYLVNVPESFVDLVVSDDLNIICAHLYFKALLHLPTNVRQWLNGLRDKSRRMKIVNATAAHFTPVLLQLEFRAISSTGFSDGFTVRACNSGGNVEIRASYAVDDTPIEFVVELGKSYPIKAAKISDGAKAVVTEGRFRAWLIACEKTLSLPNATVAEALLMFQKNVTLHLDGVSECAICYSIIGSTCKTLPTKACVTCKNKYHCTCLYKWLKSAGEPRCPLCRTMML